MYVSLTNLGPHRTTTTFPARNSAKWEKFCPNHNHLLTTPCAFDLTKNDPFPPLCPEPLSTPTTGPSQKPVSAPLCGIGDTYRADCGGSLHLFKEMGGRTVLAFTHSRYATPCSSTQLLAWILSVCTGACLASPALHSAHCHRHHHTQLPANSLPLH